MKTGNPISSIGWDTDKKWNGPMNSQGSNKLFTL